MCFFIASVQRKWPNFSKLEFWQPWSGIAYAYYSLDKVVSGSQLFCHKYQYLPHQETWGRKTTHIDRFSVHLDIVLTAKFIESR